MAITTITKTFEAYDWKDLDTEAQERARSMFAEWAWNDTDFHAQYALEYARELASAKGISLTSIDSWDLNPRSAGMKGDVVDLGLFMNAANVDEGIKRSVRYATENGRMEVVASFRDARGRNPDTRYYVDITDYRDEWRVKYTEVAIGDTLEAALSDLMGDIETAFLKTLEADIEYEYSDEGIKEACEANEWKFTKEGKLI